MSFYYSIVCHIILFIFPGAAQALDILWVWACGTLRCISLPIQQNKDFSHLILSLDATGHRATVMHYLEHRASASAQPARVAVVYVTVTVYQHLYHLPMQISIPYSPHTGCALADDYPYVLVIVGRTRHTPPRCAIRFAEHTGHTLEHAVTPRRGRAIITCSFD